MIGECKDQNNCVREYMTQINPVKDWRVTKKVGGKKDLVRD